MQMDYRYWILAGVFFMATGCDTKQEYATCGEPNTNLEVMFKAASSTNPFSHSFCVVCNPGLEKSEYGPWVVEMGAPEAPSSTDGLVPCLYVYPGEPGTPGPETLAACERLVCEGTATYSDMVNEGNGNFDLSPILD